MSSQNKPPSMIPVNKPVLSANASVYVADCIQSGWISSAGSYITKFETSFASYLGVKHATTVTNGTAALHLAVAALGVGRGDEVIMPDLTIISCPDAVLYTGATPVFVDVDPVLGIVNPRLIERAITPKTKAIMAVHLYGHPADMDPIIEIARKHNLYVIEDAAEAHGAQYKGKKVGGLGDVSCFSFYANKIVTCGEGGMVVTNNDKLYAKLTLLKDLAHSPKRRFYHEELGFNYRMTNMQAALGLAELEQIDVYIKKKRRMAELYHELLSDIPYLQLPREMPWAKSVYWMYALTVTPDSPVNRDQLRIRLKEDGVDTRDYFIPLHAQPLIRNLGLATEDTFPVSDDLSTRGFYIPSGLAITEEEIRIVAAVMKKVLK